MTQETETVSLLPCPLCGGEAEIWRAHDNGYTKPRKAWIACMDRCCAFITQEHTTNEEAIAAWNRRVSTNKDETIAKLLGLLEKAKPYVGAESSNSRDAEDTYFEILDALTSIKKEG